MGPLVFIVIIASLHFTPGQPGDRWHQPSLWAGAVCHEECGSRRNAGGDLSSGYTLCDHRCVGHGAHDRLSCSSALAPPAHAQMMRLSEVLY